MAKLGELLKPYVSLFEELDYPGLELNFNHYMEIQKGNEDCIFGFYWLMSFNATGHAHIVLIPQIGKPLEEWPIAYYDDEDGTAYTFASSIKTWFPAYFIYQVNKWYPIYLERGTEYDWLKQTLESVRKKKKLIVAHGLKFMKDFDVLYDDFLALVKKKGEWRVEEWYKRVEPKSFLTEYHPLKAASPSLEKWKKYIFKYPFFNKPLFDLLHTESVQFDNEDKDLDVELCWEFWGRFWKTDMPYYRVLPAVVKAIMEKSPKTKSPYLPFIKQIHKIIVEDEDGDYHGSESFFDLGKSFEKKKEYEKAIRCFENSIMLGRQETEEYNEDAYDHIVKCAEKIGDENYLAYIEETKDTESDDDDDDDE